MDPRYTPSTEEVRTAWFQLTQNVESFDRWLDETKKLAIADFFTENGLSYRARALKAKAWQEGIEAFDAAITRDVGDPWSQLPENPYRQGETE